MAINKRQSGITILATGIMCIACQVIGLLVRSDVLLFSSIAFGLMVVVLGFRVIFLHNIIAGKVGLALSGISAFVWLWVFPSIRQIENARIIDENEQRLSKIVFALLTYSEHDVQRRLPPAALTSKDGRPLLSWRVLILPYLGRNDLFLKFKLDEAWDGLHNKSLLRLMPNVFAPAQKGLIEYSPDTTFCQVLVGPGTAFEKVGGCRIMDDFPDGLSATILVVEASTAVPWTKPEDYVYLPGQSLAPFGALASGQSSSFFFRRPPIFCFAWGDGSARAMLYEDQKGAEEALRAAIVRNDGKEIGSWYWR